MLPPSTTLWLVFDKHADRPRPHTAVVGDARETITFQDPATPVPLEEAWARVFLGNPSFQVISPEGIEYDGSTAGVPLPQETVQRLFAAFTAPTPLDGVVALPPPLTLPPGYLIARVTDLDRWGLIRHANILAGEDRFGRDAVKADLEAYVTQALQDDPVVVGDVLAGLDAEREPDHGRDS
ncbi:hypothetical protein F1188_11045 [Roseospira marina]|uniref:Uncharacterized protein n=1 Tax=Roseospira marina TaxID=140057 RepID=A0A5M6IAW7_9PROT|nr:hypothetical protein [Roseospira marina]KAA5605430.1 hypothetical protein F1188_11045 [Roseospira marina]MBB4314575.1 hypothetical protein [Roseospira marina]MBB5088863.1 hypothetical protein [Roseospira marina]